jgi:TonB family protein
MQLLVAGLGALLLLAIPEGASITCAVKVPIPPPHQPVPDLLAQLESPAPGERVDAVTQLAGATILPDDLRATLLNLARNDVDEGVRVAAERTNSVLHWRGVLAQMKTKRTGRPPKPIRITRPEYPRAAFINRLQGTVKVLLVIDERGNVAHAEILESISGLDWAALTTVRQWKFQPAEVNGRPVMTGAIAPVAFRIGSAVGLSAGCADPQAH